MSMKRVITVLTLALATGSVSCYWGASDGNSCFGDPCCRNPRGQLCQEIRACEQNPDACGVPDAGRGIGNLAHPLDGGTTSDAGSLDGGQSDAGTSVIDAGAEDAGVAPLDDAGPADGGQVDVTDGGIAQPSDSGVSGEDDAGPGDSDAGVVDTGDTDAGDIGSGSADAGDLDAGV